MTTNAFRHRPPEQCTLSKEDQQHILRISNNDQELLDELLDELMAILRQLRPLPPRGASVRHTSRCDRRAKVVAPSLNAARLLPAQELEVGDMMKAERKPPGECGRLMLVVCHELEPAQTGDNPMDGDPRADA